MYSLQRIDYLVAFILTFCDCRTHFTISNQSMRNTTIHNLSEILLSSSEQYFKIMTKPSLAYLTTAAYWQKKKNSL